MYTQIYTYAELQAMIMPIFRRYIADYAILFGSYARNEATADSDIDLLVVGKPDFHSSDIFAIAEEPHERSGKRVDVYEINELMKDSLVYTATMAEGVCLQ